MTQKTRSGGDGDVRAFALRPVQVDALAGVSQAWKTGQRRVLLVLPTGVGKTITALEAIRRAVKNRPDGRVLWLAHREELVTQPLAAVQALDHFADVAAVAGVVRGDAADYDAGVVFSSVQTMMRDNRRDAYLAHGAPSFVVIDEAHHYVPERAWGQTALALLGADEEGVGGCHALGLTATPERADDVRVCLMWGDQPGYAFSMQEAIDAGYLCPPVFVPRIMEVSPELRDAISRANSDNGDEDDTELAQALIDEGVCEHVADVMGPLKGRATLVFCMNVAQVEQTAGLLADAGHRVGSVTGKTPGKRRRQALADYAAGRLDVLVNCGVLTEGTDLPRTDTIVLARPCGSKSLYIQIVGRGARTYLGKSEFVVVDCLGASQRHTLVSSVALDIGKDADRGTVWVATMEHRGDGYHAPKKSRWMAEEVEGHAGAPLLRLYSPKWSSGGTPVGTMSADGPLVVACKGWAQPVPKGGKRYLGQPVRRGAAWRPEWIPVGPGVRALGLGEHGLAFVVESADGEVWPVRLPKRARKPRPLNSRPVSMEVAAALVAEVGRQAAKLVDSEADWRQAQPTAGQFAYLERLGVKERPDSRGRAQWLITRARAVERAKRFGFGPGWTP